MSTQEQESHESAKRLSGGWRGAAAIGFVLTFCIAGAAAMLSPKAIEQPMPFNHRIHVVDNEFECTDCHSFYKRETFSGMPDNSTCAFCHLDELLGESEEEKQLVELLVEEKPLEWKRLFDQPAHVYYSHRRHAAVAEIDCVECHGTIGESESPPQRVRNLTMDDCLNCHEKEGVSEDCTTCHR